MTAAAAQAYKEDLLRDGANLRLPGLEAALTGPPLFSAVSPEGLATLTVRGAQLPADYLRRVYQFRLTQYLRRGWVNVTVAAARALRAEPYDEMALRDLHTLVVEQGSGRLRGYGTLAVSRDPAGAHLGHPAHRPFVAEQDYGLRLADYLGAATRSSLVGEGKRLIRDWAMPRSPAAVTVPWWVYLGWATGCLAALGHRGSAIVGDGKKSGAIHQLRLLGFSTRVLEVPPASPDPADLFAPMWSQSERSFPFILTDQGALQPTLECLAKALTSDDASSARLRLTQFREENP
jgi:hypothetical protein